MTRSFALFTLLLLALAGCAQDGGADQSAVDAVRRAAEHSAGSGARFKIDGTIDAQGQTIAITGRAAVEPGGKQGIVKMTFQGLHFESYVDGHYVLVSTDALPSTAGLPEGTRYLRLDIDKIGESVGFNSGPLRKLQSLDPATAARMAAKASNIHSVGSTTHGGLKVTRYAWSATFAQIAEALGGESDATDKMPKELRDAKLSSEVAIDANDEVRGYSLRMAVSGVKMDLKTTITSYSKDISVDVPSGSGVFDVTDALSGGLGDLEG